MNGQGTPGIDPSAFIAPGVHLIGDVRIGPRASIWHGSVLRGDINFIEVGEDTNIQDLSVMHVTRKLPCRVGAWVTAGHRVTLHGCVIEDRCLIGMGAIVLDGAVVGEGSLVGAGCLVPECMKVPPNSLVLGAPGRIVRTLGEGECPGERLARDYVKLAEEYRQGIYPPVV
jgi:carbonic anhydrase/acetyltransferase-like protein (isoleucine patch superfamily)